MRLSKPLKSTLIAALIGLSAHADAATRVLFIGNSFTYGHGSPVPYIHPLLIKEGSFFSSF